MEQEKIKFVSAYGLPDGITDEMVENAILCNFNYDTDTIYYKNDKQYRFIEFDGYVLLFKEVNEEDSLSMVDSFKAHLYSKKERKWLI